MSNAIVEQAEKNIETLIGSAATLKLTAEALAKAPFKMRKVAALIDDAAEDVLRVAVSLRSQQTEDL
jgi:hypothetical protein